MYNPNYIRVCLEIVLNDKKRCAGYFWWLNSEAKKHGLNQRIQARHLRDVK